VSPCFAYRRCLLASTVVNQHDTSPQPYSSSYNQSQERQYLAYCTLKGCTCYVVLLAISQTRKITSTCCSLDIRPRLFKTDVVSSTATLVTILPFASDFQDSEDQHCCLIRWDSRFASCKESMYLSAPKTLFDQQQSRP